MPPDNNFSSGSACLITDWGIYPKFMSPALQCVLLHIGDSREHRQLSVSPLQALRYIATTPTQFTEKDYPCSTRMHY
jgi:hypothetical protein